MASDAFRDTDSPEPRTDKPVDGETAGHGDNQSTGRVIEVALERFSRLPFSEAKLDSIARNAGMSKRMIHYYFGDKRGLYQAALTEAVRLLQPAEETMHVDSAIPVEGVSTIIDALHEQFLAHPEAVKMIQMENVQRVLNLSELSPLVDHTPVLLNLDRLLLLGQDSGAFRPGISAFDVYFLVFALLARRVTDQATALNLYGADLSTERNIAGTHRMAVDVVLAFLTANIPDDGHESYLDSSASPAGGEQDAGPTPSIYGEDDSSSSVIYG